MTDLARVIVVNAASITEEVRYELDVIRDSGLLYKCVFYCPDPTDATAVPQGSTIVVDFASTIAHVEAQLRP